MKLSLPLATLSAFAAIKTAAALEASPNRVPHFVEEPRELTADAGITVGDAGSIITSSFTIANAIIPLIGANKKECHQLACWIGTPSEFCGWAGANEAQRELIKSRNSFAIESSGPEGIWVRYWRTKFSPPDRGEIAKGNCTDGSSFSVSNCQQTGTVHC